MDEICLELKKYDFVFLDYAKEDADIDSRVYFNKVMSYMELSLDSDMFKYNIWGKPYIKKCLLQFSISHSKNFICMAVTMEKSIGIDCELIKKIDEYEQISDRFFTENENKYITESKNPIEAFYTIWCSKEALLKYYGIGINIPLNSFDTIKSNEIDFFNFENVHPIKKYIGTHFNKYKVVVYNTKPIKIIRGQFSE